MERCVEQGRDGPGADLDGERPVREPAHALDALERRRVAQPDARAAPVVQRLARLVQHVGAGWRARRELHERGAGVQARRARLGAGLDGGAPPVQAQNQRRAGVADAPQEPRAPQADRRVGRGRREEAEPARRGQHGRAADVVAVDAQPAPRRRRQRHAEPGPRIAPALGRRVARGVRAGVRHGGPRACRAEGRLALQTRLEQAPLGLAGHRLRQRRHRDDRAGLGVAADGVPRALAPPPQQVRRGGPGGQHDPADGDLAADGVRPADDGQVPRGPAGRGPRGPLELLDADADARHVQDLVAAPVEREGAVSMGAGAVALDEAPPPKVRRVPLNIAAPL